jgi:hypothetical protein
LWGKISIPPPPETGINLDCNLSCGRFFAVSALATVLALAFAGCDILAKLGFGEEEGGGSEATVTTATFTGIESEEVNGTTTRLVLVFDRAIPGLKKEHVTISPAIPESSETSDGSEGTDGLVSSEISETDALQAVAVENIGRDEGRPGVYILALSGIDALEKSLWLWPGDIFNGKLAVTVDADAVPGYRIAEPSRETDIYVAPKRRDVQFVGAEAANLEIKTKTTAALVLQISGAAGLEPLMKDDVVLSGLDGAVVPDGVPESMGNGAWKIPVAGIAAAGTVKVTLARNGYRFEPLSKEVSVFYAEPVTLDVTAADGDELLARRTTKLALAFDNPVDNLNPDDITLTANDTGAEKGSLEGSGKSYILTLANDSVTKSGKVGVTVTKDGYDVTSGPVEVAVYDNQYNHLAEGGTVDVFKDSSNAYYEVHKFTLTSTGQSLVVKSGAPALTARVLVVGGGGGAAGGSYPSSGAGAGGMVENDEYPLPPGTYAVTIGEGGAGGAGGASSKDGNNGKPSSFGTITANGGNLSKARTENAQTATVGTGGASGSGAGGTVYSNSGGKTTTSGDYAAGGGGAGSQGSSGSVRPFNTAGLYAGAGKSSDITGDGVTYAAGGPTTPYPSNDATNQIGIAGAANTGNGGGGGWNNKGGNGGSGIVIVRFQVY